MQADAADFWSGFRRGFRDVRVPKQADSDVGAEKAASRAVIWMTMFVINVSLPLLFGFLLARPGVPFLPWADARALGVTVCVAALGIGSRAVPKKSRVQLWLLVGTAAGIGLIQQSRALPTSMVAVGGLAIAVIGIQRAYPVLYLLLPVAAIVGGVVQLANDTPGANELLLSGQAWTADRAGYELLLFTAALTLAGLMDATARLLTQQEQRTAAAEEARDQAIGDERARIARELHDVVSHHVTAMTLQAEAATVTGDQGALRAVSTSGREALAELRRMLGVLRHSNSTGNVEDGPAALTPQPDLSRLEQLANRAASSLQVDIVRTGDVVPLASGVELCAYRIVQEAVTNVGKHSDANRAVVTLAYEPTQLTVEVRDDGRPLPAGRLEGSGHGLIGMTERVALLNGELETGPMPDGGFRVSARLPLEG